MLQIDSLAHWPMYKPAGYRESYGVVSAHAGSLLPYHSISVTAVSPESTISELAIELTRPISN